jgi:bifunctional oligoribonuclease and PAP phosphatase NrnA
MKITHATASQATSQAARLIASSSSIYLATHIRPDGDALGSLLGLALALEAQGRHVARLCAYPVPDYYQWLPGAARVSAAVPSWEADLGIVVDCDGLARVGDLKPTFEALPALVDIDHHSGLSGFGSVQWVDSGAAATSELVLQLVQAMGVAITPEIATCLYTGILDDTGRFAHANTTAAALRAAAELVDAGAQPAAVARKLYFERSFGSVRLLGRTLAGAQLHHGGAIVSSIIRGQDFAETGARQADTEGIIDRIRTIAGPTVAALLVEQEGGHVRVSLRSDGRPQVNQVCAQFGGGGHPGAAGCTVTGDIEWVRDQVVAAVHRALLLLDAGDGD